ncbi:MAG: TetR/AcrR family transcriptional regulator [Deltaproteobacteria bacterium]|nr:TetR/AcrR family transcriptional regulator [Deltaproteobacteria bacterium]
MTKHQSKDEWIAEILEAARVEIDENGYSEFSMEAIVRRTGFSKGGIYRFFKNKSEVGLQLFTESYNAQLDFDVNECVGWRLPMQETIFKLFIRYRLSEEGAKRMDRIWIRLLPEVLNDARFCDERARLLSEIKDKIGALCIVIAERDNIRIPADFHVKLSESFELSAALMEGFSVQTALGSGSAIEHQGILVRAFIDKLVQDIFIS